MAAASSEGAFARLLQEASVPELAFLQLEQDPRVQRLLPGEASRIVSQALSAGEEAARAANADGSATSASDFIASHGGKLVRVRGQKVSAPGIHLAALTQEARDGSIEVMLFEDALEEKTGVLAFFDMRGLAVPDLAALEELTLWHEAFHVIDFRQDGKLSAKVSTGKTKVLFGTKECRIGSAAEISAHSFACTALGGKMMLDPWRCDALYLAGVGEITEEELALELQDARRLMEEGRRDGDL